MYGAIIGDVVGSTYEFEGIKTVHFSLLPRRSSFTDDSILTMAVASALMLSQETDRPFPEVAEEELLRWGNEYPNPMGGYGSRFRQWLFSNNPTPYNSCGNGSAMRVSPCGLFAVTMEEALELAEASALPTHNHPEGIKGAKATAAAIFLAKTGHSKEDIRAYIEEHFYPLDRTVDQIRMDYEFDGTCQGSVPESIIAFLESKNYEDAIRLTISLGGDADTMAAITGAIAWSYYRFETSKGISAKMANLWIKVADLLPPHWLDMVLEFDTLCRRREEEFRKTGTVKPVRLA